MTQRKWAAAINALIKDQLKARGIVDRQVIDAVKRVPRHLFVPKEYRSEAYNDRPLPIGYNQTISQPFIVAYMLDKLELSAEHKVLEIGTGSGYQTALLAELVKEVYSIEIEPALHHPTKRLLARLGYRNIYLRVADGFAGWRENAPFDRIILSAAPELVPRELVRELKQGGKLILPLGKESQELILVCKKPDGLVITELGAVRFVPMHEED